MTEDAGDLDLAHPSSEKLSAYQANELSPEEDDAIQEHVAGCRLCAERLLELERFLEPVGEGRGEGVVDFETAAEWRRLRGRMGSPVRRFFGSLKTAYGIAAVLLLIVGVLSWQLTRMRPTLNTHVVALSSTVGALAPGDEIEEVDIPPEAENVLFLIGSSKGGYPSYRGELSTPADRGRVWRLSGLRKVGGHFTFEIPWRRLSSGDYEIRVFGLKNGSEDLVAARKMRLRLQAPTHLP